jgi:hypothetical protein
MDYRANSAFDRGASVKHKYLILLIFLFSPQNLSAAELGRLFLTPEQRSQLDVARVRRDQRPLINNDAAQSSAAPVPQGPAVVTYGGSVRRSDGKSTVWINGKPITERNQIRNDTEVSVLGMRRDGALSIAIPQAQRTASLKVGQQLDVNSGRIDEPYARRTTLPQSALLTAPETIVSSPTTAVTPSPRPKRPSRESEFKEADPESGAAPAERRPSK